MAPAAAAVDRRPASLALLESKLTLPLERPGTIRRAALVNRMRARRHPTITVVAAPLGYGKTTLLADWARKDERAFAWVSLDESDNDPVVFLTYVAEALDRVAALEGDVFEALGSPGASPRRVVAAVGRSLASFDVPAVLVLDDVHVVERPETWSALALLVDHLPEHVQLALATRTGSPLPLARLRAEGRLVEIGTDDLRLRERDAAEVLSSAGVKLSHDDLADLTRRTEGWPAGLYLAALALQHTNQPSTAFRGSDRFVGDYFRDELISNLDPEQVAFLTRASVLDRMCGALCDDVVGRSGSADLLADLESSNLFVVPLDHERNWYRFHHLFRDMLRHELERREPELSRRLLSRAADWCERHGDHEAAIEYVQSAGENDRLVGLVEKHAWSTAWTGRFATLERWLSWLDDPEVLERFPSIAFYGAEIYPVIGRPEDAMRWAATAERTPDDVVLLDGSPAGAWKAMLRAQMFESNPEEMRAEGQRAVAMLAPGSPFRTNALNTLGMARLASGDDVGADSTFGEAAESGRAAGATPGLSIASAMRSLIAIAHDDWHKASAYADEARDAIRGSRLEHYLTSSFAYAAHARISLRRNEWAQAQADLEHGESLVESMTYALPAWGVKARIEFARARFAIGDLPRVLELLAEIETIMTLRPNLGVLVAESDELRELAHAKGSSANGWASSFTAAELRLLPLLATHLSFAEIGEQVHISRNTVKTHAIKIYRKLGVSSRSDAVKKAIDLRLLEPTKPASSGK